MARLVLSLLFSFIFIANCLSTNRLQSVPSNIASSVIAEAEPNSFVNKSVNVIYGSFYHTSHDLIVPGAEPLHFCRYYNSQNTTALSWLAHGMSSNYPMWIGGLPFSDGKYAEMVAEGDGGSIVKYIARFNKKEMDFYLHPQIIHEGLTNGGSADISARTNLKNNRYTYETEEKQGVMYSGIWSAKLADGGLRKYHKGYNFEECLNLKYEEKPNGNKLFYEHDSKGIKKIEAKDAREKHTLGWLKFDTDDDTLIISSSNNKEVNYKFFKRWNEHGEKARYIEKVSSTDQPTIYYDYISLTGERGDRRYVNRISWPEGRFLEVEYDKHGRVEAQKAPIGREGEKHTVYRFEYRPHEWHTIVHDAHNKRESGIAEHSYENDSLANQVKKDGKKQKHDSTNQLLENDSSDFEYDKNGNLIEKRSRKRCISYRYDALNRLIEVKEKEKFLSKYFYDSFNRRLKKQLFSWNEHKEKWEEVNTLRFVYFGEREVGALNSKGEMIEFRAIGRGKGAEIGASVAIETEDGLFAPTHDHRGNICNLIHAKSGKAEETKRYSAFGDEQIFDSKGKPQKDSKIPWGFASKRHDPETGFIYFGKRYYCPEMGRFITQDPLGYDEGPNLYAYVNNNPLVLMDPYGLCILRDPSNSLMQDKGENAFTNNSNESAADTGNSLWSDDSLFSNKHRLNLIDIWKNEGSVAVVRELQEVFANKEGPATDLLILLLSRGAAGGVSGSMSRCLAIESTTTAPKVAQVAVEALSNVGLEAGASSFAQRAKLYFRPSIARSTGKIASNKLGVGGVNTRSTTARGTKIHKSYRSGEENIKLKKFKEYRLESGKRADFVDASTEVGIIYELKPCNSRSITEGLKQLELYKNELMKDPRFNHVKTWETRLETYSNG